MQMRKAIITVAVSILTVLLQGYVYADNNQALSNPGKLDEVSVGKIVPNELDNSNVLVEVTLTTSSGESSVIYTGVLSGYDEEMLEYVDFSAVDAVILFDWETDDTYVIKRIEETISQNEINNVLMSTGLIQPNLNISANYYINDNLITGDFQNENICAGDELNASYSITNQGNASQEVHLILCLYDDNHRLLNTSITSETVMANETRTVEETLLIGNDVDNCYAKVLLWDSLSGLYPLYNPVQIGNVNVSQNVSSATVECVLNKEYNLVTTVENMHFNDDGIYTIKYNPDALQVIDLCSLTYKKELEVGTISGTNITILSVNPVSGEIVFKNPNTNDSSVSKVLNSIKFKGLISNEQTVITIE